MKRGARKRRGATLIEVLVGASICVLTLVAGVACFMAGMQSWLRGEGAISADRSVNETARTVTSELREAVTLSISTDGTTVNYQKPSVDATGRYVMPLVADGVNRRFQLISGELRHTVGTTTWVLAKGIQTTDPSTNAAYRVFSAANTAIIRQVTFMLVSRQTGFQNSQMSGRIRENIFIRNVPEVTR